MRVIVVNNRETVLVAFIPGPLDGGQGQFLGRDFGLEVKAAGEERRFA